ncbi:MAG: hypothetical protein H0U49_09680 [Parachlamydiaceae bacterium]|nr:hypothetical protein [Parachlamydiaceae bacterium]
MKISRRYMLLVELLIAMSLTMVILSMMLVFYDQVDRANSALEKEQNHSFRMLYLSTRLAAVVPKAVSSNNPEKDFFFFSSTGIDSFAKPGTSSLVFAFDNGVKFDPIYSNHVIGRLYVNQQDQLCLATWPAPSRWKEGEIPPMKNEVLYDHIESLFFTFYIPPAKERQIILDNNRLKKPKNDDLPLEIAGDWKSEWSQEFKDLPALIKIFIGVNTSQGKQEIVLAYPLPKSNQIILYDR